MKHSKARARRRTAVQPTAPLSSRQCRVFIASSSKQLKLAQRVKDHLSRTCYVRVWTEAFDPGQMLLPSLLNLVSEYDFGVFIFAEDDTLVRKGVKHAQVRDNVLFELGVFMGALGHQRTFVLAQRGGKLSIPVDHGGLLTANLQPAGSRGKSAKLKSELQRISSAIGKQGPALRNVYNELSLLQQRVDQFEFEVNKKIYAMGALVRNAVANHGGPWFELTHPLRLMRPIRESTSNEVADFVYWELVVLGVLSFKSTENFTDGSSPRLTPCSRERKPSSRTRLRSGTDASSWTARTLGCTRT